MNKRVALLFFALISAHLYADDPEEEETIQALKAWLSTKRQVTVKELGGALSISGDVRVEYLSMNEVRDGIKNIGPHSRNPLVADNQFDVEFNFMLDYRTDLSWAAVKVEFDNNMGVISGTLNRVTLERAFLGFRMLEGTTYTLDGELGRRRLDYTFDSRIEFGAYMDGALVKFNKSAEKWGDFYLNGGPFVVDEVNNHFAYVAEAGVLNFYNSGAYFKYSIIDWHTHHYKNKILQRRFSYCNSQFILGYKFIPKSVKKPLTFYGAFLVNTAAKKLAILNYHKQNLAGYLGMSLGELRKKGDWTIDTNYQYVQYQAVPDYDFNGIGKGNTDGTGLYTIKLDGTGIATTIFTAVGKAGYQGWQMLFLYLVNDNITISQSFKISYSLPPVKTQFRYKAYRLEIIYAW